MPILINTTELKVGVYTEDITTTTPAHIKCKHSIRCESNIPQPDVERLVSFEKTAFANILKGKTNGSSCVVLDDVSPYEHEMSVKLSGVEDLTAATVYKQGKNFLRFDDGTYTMRRSSAGTMRTVTITLSNSHMRIDYEPNSWYNQTDWISAIKPYTTFYLPAGSYKLCALNTIAQSKTTCTLQIMNADTDTTLISIQAANTSITDKISETLTLSTGQYVYCYCYLDNSNATNALLEADIAIYKITSDNTFEPYIVPTEYIPNADGVVGGITSIYPTTTLYTKDSGVQIACEYNKDTNKVIEKLSSAIISLGGKI